LTFFEELTMRTIDVVRCSLKPLAILLLTLPLAAQGQVRILQSNAAGDRVHLIDPVTNKVVAEIPGIETAHGITASPDATRIFVSNEADRTLDVVDVKTLKVTKKIPLSGRPNNIAITPDGKKVYVGIRQGGESPGVADVIDTASLTKVKSVRTEGPVHNLYVTLDGKFMFAGDGTPHGYVSVIDAQTDTPAWSVKFDGPIRPMTSDKNPDGSTRNLYVQWGDENGFAVVDFKTRKITQKILEYPKLGAGRVPILAGSGEAHGLAVTPDQKTLVACSRLNNAVYSYSLPDLKLAGTANLSGKGCAWLTVTPDGKRAYAADPVGNSTLVIDIPTMKEVAKIAVGQVPKRNHTMVVPAGRAATQ
jgi:YVTN family beta-propeller protein